MAGMPFFDPAGAAGADRVLVPLPADVDRLLAVDPGAVRDWRLRLRAELTAAFTAGYAIVGFAPAATPGDDPVYLLAR